MPFNADVPTPDACIIDSSTLRVASFNSTDWPSATGSYALTASIDGTTWYPIGDRLFAYNLGDDIPVTQIALAPGVLLRYQSDWAHGETCNWVASVNITPSAPSGYHYEYAWSGDVTGVTTSDSVLINDVVGPGTEERTATVTVSLVRNSDDFVECTETLTESEFLEVCSSTFSGGEEGNFGSSFELEEYCSSSSSSSISSGSSDSSESSDSSGDSSDSSGTSSISSVSSLNNCTEVGGPTTVVTIGCDVECFWIPPPPSITAVDGNKNNISIIAPTDVPSGKTLTLLYKKDEDTVYTSYQTGVTSGLEILITLDPCTRYYFKWITVTI